MEEMWNDQRATTSKVFNKLNKLFMFKESGSNLGSIEIKRLIVDAGNQFVCFNIFPKIEEAKKHIAQSKFKTLEEYTGKSRKELEKEKPGVCDGYNNLIEKIKDPKFNRR